MVGIGPPSGKSLVSKTMEKLGREKIDARSRPVVAEHTRSEISAASRERLARRTAKGNVFVRIAAVLAICRPGPVRSSMRRIVTTLRRGRSNSEPGRARPAPAKFVRTLLFATFVAAAMLLAFSGCSSAGSVFDGVSTDPRVPTCPHTGQADFAAAGGIPQLTARADVIALVSSRAISIQRAPTKLGTQGQIISAYTKSAVGKVLKGEIETDTIQISAETGLCLPTGHEYYVFLQREQDTAAGAPTPEAFQFDFYGGDNIFPVLHGRIATTIAQSPSIKAAVSNLSTTQFEKAVEEALQ